MKNLITNIAGYQFVTIDNPATMYDEVQKLCAQTHLRGTIFISPEGINLSLAGESGDIEFIIGQLESACGFNHLLFNTSYSREIPFRRLLVKIRDKLVATKPRQVLQTSACNDASCVTSTQYPETGTASYISSAVLKQWLDEDKDFTLLDLRNSFEYELGSFDRARHLGITHFREFENAANKLEEIPLDKPVVTFCTGGIRCEKGAPYIAKQDFQQVYQLKGGILDYLKNFKNSDWHGDCFVFDERVSLDHALNPTYANLCRSCQTSLQEDEERFCATCANLG